MAHDTGDDEARTDLLMLPDSHSSEKTAGNNSATFYEQNGPFVINSDGTLSRIKNWNQMAEVERERAKRMITQRNRQRMEVIKDQIEKPLTPEGIVSALNENNKPVEPEK